MNDFIFGTLATDELRLEHVRKRRAGVTHVQNRQPRDPLPDQPVTLYLSVGPAQPVDRAWLYWTNDGSDPEGALGLARNGFVTQMEPDGAEWDTQLWSYVRNFKVTLPGQPSHTILRYQLSADAGTSEVFADEGAYYACYIANDPTPAWTQKAVVYQIFVDRFFPGAYKTWEQPGSPSGFYGGTLRGIADKVAYLSDLGVNTLWLTPIFPSPSHHGYDSTDLFEIEPRLGNRADLRLLIQGANAHGMRILLDFVPNHWSYLHNTFQHAIKDPDSPYRAWYNFRHWPDEYETFFGVKELPQVNLRYLAARQYMLDAAKHWLDFGVDGYRVDYALGPSPDFWAEFRRLVTSTQLDAWTFGEVVEPSDTQLTFEGGLDGCLDFIMLEGFRQTFAYDRWSGVQFGDFIRRHEAFFPPTFSRPTFLDNHDMNRFLWAAGGDKRRLKLAALSQFSLSGQPVIYYGTEVGLSQERDTRYPDGRGVPEEARLPMLWDEAQDTSLLAFYKQLIALRKKDASLRRPTHQILQATADTLVYTAEQQDPGVITLLNLSEEARHINLPGDYKNVLLATDTDCEVKFTSGQAQVDLPALSGLYLS